MAKYLDNAGVVTLWSKIKSKDETVLSSAKSYATSQDETVLSSAKSYATSQDETVLSSAKSYATSQDETVLSSAKSYATSQDETVLSSAKSYATSQDETVLTNAKKYSDEVAATIEATKQNVLTAGEGIEINNNVISATGAGTSTTSKLYYHNITSTYTNTGLTIVTYILKIIAITSDKSPISTQDGVNKILKNGDVIRIDFQTSKRTYRATNWYSYDGDNSVCVFYTIVDSSAITNKYKTVTLGTITDTVSPI